MHQVSEVDGGLRHARHHFGQAGLLRVPFETRVRRPAASALHLLHRPQDLLHLGRLGLVAGGFGGAQLAGGPAGEALQDSFSRALADWTDAAIATLQNLFQTAENTVSPLVLDLDGNGVTTLGIAGATIQFDHDGNGFAERTGWVGVGDALLVRDRNGDGRITTGNELFGNHTRLSDGSLAGENGASLAGEAMSSIRLSSSDGSNVVKEDDESADEFQDEIHFDPTISSGHLGFIVASFALGFS